MESEFRNKDHKYRQNSAEKYKTAQQKYAQSEKGRAVNRACTKRYRQTERGKEVARSRNMRVTYDRTARQKIEILVAQGVTSISDIMTATGYDYEMVKRVKDKMNA